MIRAYLASGNSHKVTEVQRILTRLGVEIDLLSADGVDGFDSIVENGSTFAANALIKARAVCEVTGVAAIADDSGICVDALNGMPGIFSARWAGRHGDDSANLHLLLRQLADVPDSRRTASFWCSVALVLPDGSEAIVEGDVQGRLLRAPAGESGFGYDPIFVPDGFTCTTAQMSAEEKDTISHRGRALSALAPILIEMLR